jgi:iron complex transport system substrate-binding protein
MKRWLILFAALPLFAHAAAERIISLGGDVTEIVYALEAQQQLVAKDSTSTWPAAARSLPDVGYIRQLNAEGILSLRPTLVLASAQAQPSLVLQKVEDSRVKVVNIPGGNDLSAIDKKIAASPTHWVSRLKATPCAASSPLRSRKSPRSRSVNGCCLFSATAE